MKFGFAVLCAIFAGASAGYLGAPAVSSYGIGLPAVGYGGYGGLGDLGYHAPSTFGYAAPGHSYGAQILPLGYASAPAISHYSPSSAVSYSNTYKTALAAPTYGYGALSYGLGIGGHYGYGGAGHPW